jgi:hypothetical protein
MAEKQNRRIRQLKGELAQAIKTIRQVQADLNELKARGADETEIRKVMVAQGFAAVTMAEFMAVGTVEDMARLITKLRSSDAN